MLWLRAALLLVAACAAPTDATVLSPVTATLTVIKSLDDASGAQPRSGLSLGPDGKLWGAAWQRGPNGPDAPDGTNCNSTVNFDDEIQRKRCPGTVFRLALDGSGFEVVHAFTQLDALYRNPDGYQPTAAPVDGGDGWMYGTTTKGGIPIVNSTAAGRGVLYRINAFTLEYQVVYALGAVTPNIKDGANPYGGLVFDGLGRAYISTHGGGQYPNSAGAILRMDLATLEVVVVHGFGKVCYACDPDTNSDGGNAFAPPAPVAGKLVAWEPGWGPLGGGTIAVVDPSAAWDATAPLAAAWARTTPTINTDNAALASLTVLDDRIVGVRPYQGDNGTGEIFALDLDGRNYRAIYSFDRASASSSPHYANAGGAAPLGTLAEDCDGSLVGTAFYGGASGTGVVYRIGPDGTGAAVLYQFSADQPGAPRHPSSGLIRVDGAWFGTTQAGGEYGPGTIYRIDIKE